MLINISLFMSVPYPHHSTVHAIPNFFLFCFFGDPGSFAVEGWGSFTGPGSFQFRVTNLGTRLGSFGRPRSFAKP